MLRVYRHSLVTSKKLLVLIGVLHQLHVRSLVDVLVAVHLLDGRRDGTGGRGHQRRRHHHPVLRVLLQHDPHGLAGQVRDDVARDDNVTHGWFAVGFDCCKLVGRLELLSAFDVFPFSSALYITRAGRGERSRGKRERETSREHAR